MQAIKMIMGNKFLSLAAAALFVLGVGVSYTVNSANRTYAGDTQKCFDFYGREIECPQAEIDIDIKKGVRSASMEDYVSDIDNPFLNDQRVFYKIIVTNVGEVSLDDLKLVDILPENHDNFELDAKLVRVNDRLEFTFGPDFEPGEREVFLFEALTNVDGINPGEKKCEIENVAKVFRDRDGNGEISEGETVRVSKTEICIKRGEVLGEQPTLTPTQAPGELPDTAAGGLGLILGSIVALGSGAVLTRRIDF